MNDLEYARQPLLDALAQAFALYGWPEITGRLFGLLYLEAGVLSQDELGERLGVSKATVSTNVRSLEILHLVHRARGSEETESSGGRPRVYYQAERDFLKVAQELLRHNARRELELMERGLSESQQRLQPLTESPDSALAQQALIDLESIRKLDGYKRWGRSMLWMVQSVTRMQQFVSSFWAGETGN